MRLFWRLALALAMLPVLMGATIYRWVDANGVVNYSQQKPEGVNAELVDSDTGQRSSASRAPAPPDRAAGQAATAQAQDGGSDQQLSDAQKKMLADLRAAESARQEKLTKIRKANCQQAKSLLDRLTSRGRIRVKGDDGQERVMPEEERRQRIDDAQKAVAENCAATASR